MERHDSIGMGGGLPTPREWGEGRTRVRLELRAQGRDLLLVVTGGEAHVGAAAVAAPDWAEARLVVVPGHKEGPLAAAAAIRLARAAGCTCAVVAGIHQDGATRDEITAIVGHVEAGLADLATALADRRGWRP